MPLIDKIIQDIGLGQSSDIVFDINTDLWKKKVPLRIKKGLELINPDKFIVQDNRLVAIFFDHSNQNFDNSNLVDLFKKVWNLGGVPIIFIVNDTDVEIYNGFAFNLNKKSFEELKSKGKKIDINNVSEEISIWDLITGKIFKQFANPKHLVDETLLSNLETTKDLLVAQNLNEEYAQNIIARLLFARYLIDRGIKIDSQYFTNNDSFLDLIQDKTRLYQYFDYIKRNFNGDLFPVCDEEFNQVNKTHLTLLFQLFSGYQISNAGVQYSLFDTYDFKIIPIELISEVYERFMGKKKQKRQSAYYTPSFLVDYVIENTVKKRLEEKNICKVLDPSCGSGIFLVESLRHIIESNLDINDQISKEKLVSLVTSNIFGIDIDPISINLTAFSLCLTLLDYIDPKDINSFKFPSLKNNNLFISNFFDFTAEFNSKIKDIDFVIGNPPWGSKPLNVDPLHANYVESLQAKSIQISDYQIAQSFIIRAKSFATVKTKFAFLLPSKILYNHKALEFRKTWLENFALTEVLELSAVRRYLFSGAIAPTIIAFFALTDQKNGENIVRHISIKPNIFIKYIKLLVIEKSDLKLIKQKYFQLNDWAWKVLLYGNVLDFYFIQDLKSIHLKFSTFLAHNESTFGAGYKIANKKNHMHSFANYSTLTPKELKPYFLPKYLRKLKEINKELQFENFGIESSYTAPHLVIKRSLKDMPIVAYSNSSFCFPNTIYGINNKNERLLKAIGTFLTSSFSRYYLFLTSSTWGVEREEILKNEYESIPTLDFSNDIIDKLANEYERLSKETYNSYTSILHPSNLNLDHFQSTEELLMDFYNLTKLERRLIDYCIQISLPLFFNNEEPNKPISEEQVGDYLEVFQNFMNNQWNGNPNYYSINVFFNPWIVGVEFKILTEKPEKLISFHKNDNSQLLLDSMKLGEEKFTNLFYKQRDVKHIGKSEFLIVKTNQYKNWHPAIAEGDLREFINSMLKTQGVNNT